MILSHVLSIPHLLLLTCPFHIGSVYSGSCQQVKWRKDVGDNRIKPEGKRVKMRFPILKNGGVKAQSLLTQVLEKGRFVRLGQSTILTPGKNTELRCKGSLIGWSYPSYLDTFNDSRIRCWKQTLTVGSALVIWMWMSYTIVFPPAALHRMTSTVNWSWCHPLQLTRVPTAVGW